MPNEEWGVKRLCPTTGKRFYDLNKTPIISPYTGEVVELEDTFRKGSSAGARAAAEKAAKAAAAPIESEDLLEDDDTDEADIDDDLLEDDDDDTVSLDDIADVGGDDDEG